MDGNHKLSFNTAYINNADLQLSGNQINLSERPKANLYSTTKRKIAKRNRPCRLRRPMSATPFFGHLIGNKTKNDPKWSRPQSAGGSSNLQHSKLVERYSDSFCHDSEYCDELGAAYTISSSQHLQSLGRSCSLIEELGYETTRTSSPQSSLGERNCSAIQLEPGLTAKPPLPPSTPIPQAPLNDDIIALKFQRWFPDSILETDIQHQNPPKKEKNKSEIVFNSEMNKNSNNNKINFNSFSKNPTCINYPDTDTYLIRKKGESDREKTNLSVTNLSNIDVDLNENSENCSSNLSSLEKCNNSNNKIQKFLSLSNLNDMKIPDGSHVVRTHSDSNMYQPKSNELIGVDNLKEFSDSESLKIKGLNNNSPKNGTEMLIYKDEALSNNGCSEALVSNNNDNQYYDASDKNRNGKQTHVCNEDFLKEPINNFDSTNCNEECGNCGIGHIKPLKLGTKEVEELYHTSDLLLENKTLDYENRNNNEVKSKSSNSISSLNVNNKMYMQDEVKPYIQSIESVTLSSKINSNSNSKLKSNLNKKDFKQGAKENVRKNLDFKDQRPIKDTGKSAQLNSKVFPLQSKVPFLKLKPKGISYETMSENSERDSGVSSFEDIVTMIKVLETEDLESPIINHKSKREELGHGISTTEHSSSVKDIMTFLDEVERGSETSIITSQNQSASNLKTPWQERGEVSSCLGTLLNTDVASLAQQVMSLTLKLEDKTADCKRLQEQNKQNIELLKQQETEVDMANKRQQKFIDQLIEEKRQLAVQYESAIYELNAKHKSAIKTIEERHKVEMKKAQDKFNASEKIKRDKWIDAKTKKIKELTVRGLEPELERMAASHQEELAELRRLHQRQLAEEEAAWNRRAAALREQEASERHAAVMQEREAARFRLEQDLNQIEKSYQEQRKRLLDEVREEKELIHRQSERILSKKQDEMEKKVDEANKKLQAQLMLYEKKHQEEIEKIKEAAETEKQLWLSQQRISQDAREAALKEELKRDRDRHIELAIRRLETEATEKEEAIENKLKRLKESYDAEINDLDTALKELRARLKEARGDLQKSEDNNSILVTELGKANNEIHTLKQMVEKLQKDSYDIKQQKESEIDKLQKEITEVKEFFQDKINKLNVDKEKQLQDVYKKVKLAISKKDETLAVVITQRDVALEQCGRLEEQIKTGRNQAFKL